MPSLKKNDFRKFFGSILQYRNSVLYINKTIHEEDSRLLFKIYAIANNLVESLSHISQENFNLRMVIKLRQLI